MSTKFAKLHTYTEPLFAPFYKFRPDQRRDERGRWVDEGKGGGGWGRAAVLTGSALLAAGATAAAMRNPAAAAAIALGGLRTADRYTGNLANRVLFGGGGVGGRATVNAVSRSKLEASAFNITTGARLTPELRKHFGDLDISVKRSHGHSLELTIKSRDLTDAVINQMHSSGNTDLLKRGVYLNATIDKRVGNILRVDSLYAPDSTAGKLFVQKAFVTVRDLAVANNADAVTTPAGWAMGGYLWPNAGFQLLGAGNPPISLGLRAAGIWEETAIRAEALRTMVEMRARELFNAKAIDRSTYGKIVALLDDLNWSPDTPAIISNINRTVNIDGIRLLGMPNNAAAREIRGDVTLGKALLAHTNGTYILPKHLYERMFTITKRATVADRLTLAGHDLFALG
jgi:hypothetical protein